MQHSPIFLSPPYPRLDSPGSLYYGLIFRTDAWQVGHHAQFVLLYVYYLLTVPDSTEEGRLQMAVILSFAIVSTSMSIHAYVVLQRGLFESRALLPPICPLPLSMCHVPSCHHVTFSFFQNNSPHCSLLWLLLRLTRAPDTNSNVQRSWKHRFLSKKAIGGTWTENLFCFNRGA